MRMACFRSPFWISMSKVCKWHNEHVVEKVLIACEKVLSMNDHFWLRQDRIRSRIFTIFTPSFFQNHFNMNFYWIHSIRNVMEMEPSLLRLIIEIRTCFIQNLIMEPLSKPLQSFKLRSWNSHLNSSVMEENVVVMSHNLWQSIKAINSYFLKQWHWY